jgi:hypothetical protein
VSAESGYIHHLVKTATLVTDLVKRHVEQKKYVRSVCDKVVGSIIYPRRCFSFFFFFGIKC